MRFTTASVPEVGIPADIEREIDAMMAAVPNPPLDQEIKERIRLWLCELQIDAIGLWQIVPALRNGYELAGENLQRYLQIVVTALLRSGAKPVMGCGPNGYYSWRPTAIFGETVKAMARIIAAEWANNAAYPDVEDAWFAIQAIYDSPRRDIPLQFFTEEELAKLAKKQ